MPIVKAHILIEMMGRPAAHLKESLNTHVIKMGSEKGVKLLNTIYHKPVYKKEANKLYHTFSEIEAEFESFDVFFNVIFNYMPANVEIFEPEKFKLQSSELNQLSNYLLARLHQYDAIAKSLFNERTKLIERKEKILRKKGISSSKKILRD